ncbi:MAG: FHA domain-containing protein [Corynebacterium sp.]|nr:FHA domain-containing protein [Corynebacterium sp.]
MVNLDDQLLGYIRIGLLIVLWLFVFLALKAMSRTTAPVIAEQTGRHGQGGLRKSKGSQPQFVQAGGQQMALTGINQITFGRSQSNTFPLADDYASGSHARLMRSGNSWVIEDLDSRNGTFVNGVRIDQPEKVDINSEITIGQTPVRLVA